MADIFISYAREDRECIERFAKLLSGYGYSVWWDREIVPGEKFDDALTRELALAKCVIVFWSKHAVTSDWVREEAEDAKSRGILVPVALDDSPIPLGFRRIHAALIPSDLVDHDDRTVRAVAAKIGQLVGRAPTFRTDGETPPPASSGAQAQVGLGSLQTLRWRRALHLVAVLVVVAVSSGGVPGVGSVLKIAPLNEFIFRHLARLNWSPARPENVRLVLIDDDTYTHTLHRRRPTRRDYLADVIRALDDAGARVIALDFDLSLVEGKKGPVDLTPDVTPGFGRRPAKLADFARMRPEYWGETDALIATIADVAQRRHIVLTRAINTEGKRRITNGEKFYNFDPDIWELYGLCAEQVGDGTWQNTANGLLASAAFGQFSISASNQFSLSDAARANISCGYIEVSGDQASVLGRIKRKGSGQFINSFALAIAKAYQPVPDEIGDRVSYAYYIPEDALQQVTISSARLLAENELTIKSMLRDKIVIMGSGWSKKRNDGCPDRTDMHRTPVGCMLGGYMIAGFTEAFLAQKGAQILPYWAVLSLQLGFGTLAAFCFLFARTIKATVLALAPALVAIVLVQWLLLQVYGIFLNTFVCVVVTWLFVLAGRVLKTLNWQAVINWLRSRRKLLESTSAP